MFRRRICEATALGRGEEKEGSGDLGCGDEVSDDGEEIPLQGVMQSWIGDGEGTC